MIIIIINFNYLSNYLGDDVAVAVDGLSDEALAAGDVAPVRIGVDQPRLGLLPLPEAAVLSLFKHLG